MAHITIHNEFPDENPKPDVRARCYSKGTADEFYALQIRRGDDDISIHFRTAQELRDFQIAVQNAVMPVYGAALEPAIT